jgi:hypothetical protein
MVSASPPSEPEVLPLVRTTAGSPLSTFPYSRTSP